MTLCVKVLVQDTEYALYYQIEFSLSTEMRGAESISGNAQFYSLDRDGHRVNVQYSFYLYCIIVTRDVSRWNRLHDQETAQKKSLKRKHTR